MSRPSTTTSICTLLSICLIGLIAVGPLFNCCGAHDVKNDTCHILDLQNETAFEFEETRIELEKVESLLAIACEETVCRPTLVGYVSLCGATSLSAPVDSQRGPPALVLIS
jgi:hypothetical protein